MLSTFTQQQVSLIFCTLVVLFTSYELYRGRINVHLHDQVHHTHQISTVSTVLQLLLTSLISFYHNSLLTLAGAHIEYWPFKHINSDNNVSLRCRVL